VGEVPARGCNGGEWSRRDGQSRPQNARVERGRVPPAEISEDIDESGFPVFVGFVVCLTVGQCAVYRVYRLLRTAAPVDER
jgi:hypothetical protein